MAVWKVIGMLGLVGLVVSVPLGSDAARAETLTVAAAYSLKPGLREILPLFEQQYKADVRVIYGPSQTLRKQIEDGAPVDVFLPASFEQVEELNQRRLTLGDPRIYAETSLVLIAAAQARVSPGSFNKMDGKAVTRIALGDPKTSALGQVTTQLLAKLDPARRLRGRYLYGEHSEIVGLVSSGEADMGIVYRVDAVNSSTVRIIDEAPAGTHTPVLFGEAVVWTCRHASYDLAKEFMDFMLTPAVQGILQKYGFSPVSPGVRSARATKK